MLNHTPTTVAHILNELRKTIVGQDDAIEQILVAVLAEGHALIEGVPGTKTFYVAAAAGGIWKTTNAGTTFKPLFNSEKVISIGDIAIAPSNPLILYAGTGEESIRNSARKSTNKSLPRLVRFIL